MKKIFLTMIIIFLNCSMCSALKICSYNISIACNSNHELSNEVHSIIMEKDPDIILIQEAGPKSYRYLKDKFAKTHPYASFTKSEVHSSFACYSKIKILKTIHIPGDHGMFDYQALVFRHKTPFFIFNTHLNPPHLRKGLQGGILGLMNEMKKNEKTHIKELDVVINFAKKRPAIIVGDFNTFDKTSPITHLNSKGFSDAADGNTKNRDKTTWHMKLKMIPFDFKIDYIFHSKEFKSIDYDVLQKGPSDHYMIYSELEILKND